MKLRECTGEIPKNGACGMLKRIGKDGNRGISIKFSSLGPARSGWGSWKPKVDAGSKEIPPHSTMS